MFFLLLFIALNPLGTILLLTIDNFIQIVNLLGELCLSNLELPIKALLLDVERLVGVLQVDHCTVKLLNFDCALRDGLVLEPDDLLEVPVLLSLVKHLRFQVVAGLVHLVELFYDVVVVALKVLVVLVELFVIDLQGA